MPMFVALALLQSIGAQPSPSEIEGMPPTFEQAMKLPVKTLARQALGSSGVLFHEVQRPYLGGLPPVTSYSLTFASEPERTQYDGLCRASTVTIVYWSRDKISENIWNHPVVAKFWQQEELFRYLPLTEDKTGNPSDCQKAGPVLRERNIDWDEQNPGFGYGDAFGRKLTEIDAYFAGRAIKKAILHCNGVRCRLPEKATAAFPIGRLSGMDVDYCEDRETKLCVTAYFSQPSPRIRPGPIYGLRVNIVTDATQISQKEFAVTSVSHERTEAHVH